MSMMLEFYLGTEFLWFSTTTFWSCGKVFLFFAVGESEYYGDDLVAFSF